MFLIIFLIICSQQIEFDCDLVYGENKLFIQSEDVGILLYQDNSSIQIYVAQSNEGYMIFNESLNSSIHLSYNNGFELDSRKLQPIEKVGEVKLTTTLISFLSSKMEHSVESEVFQKCFNFDTERIAYLTFLILLFFLMFATNSNSMQNCIHKELARVIQGIPLFNRIDVETTV